MTTNHSDKKILHHIALLGSTGSIGTQTLDIVRAYPEELRVSALAAGRNVTLMEEQVREFRPQVACMWDETAAKDLRERIRDTETTVVSGMEGLLQIAEMEEADLVLTAVVGMIGIRPTLAAIAKGIRRRWLLRGISSCPRRRKRVLRFCRLIRNTAQSFSASTANRKSV